MIAIQAELKQKSWLESIRADVERVLAQALPKERRADADWQIAHDRIRELALRPAKRIRPALLVAGFGIARGIDAPSEALWSFAAGLELMHLFMLIHDDVADRASIRRGGPSLHTTLSSERSGPDLAVVAGDYLFARSIELMLEPELTFSTKAVRYYLNICKETAIGQFMDIGHSGRTLSETHLFRVVKIAMLKTARYSFVGPLAAGAVLSNAPQPLIDKLERVGRHLGLAYQLRDDFLGLFGDDRALGKSSASDFTEGKKTFPIVAAYTRATEAGRAEIDALFAGDRSDPAALDRLRHLVEQNGGKAATARAIDRSHRAAASAVKDLPDVGELRSFLEWAVSELGKRQR